MEAAAPPGLVVWEPGAWLKYPQKNEFLLPALACSMAEAEADPVAARWLPQQVYVGLAPPPAAADDEGAGPAGSADQQQHAQQAQQQPRRAEWRPQPQPQPQPPAAAEAAAQPSEGQDTASSAPQTSSNGSGASGQHTGGLAGAAEQQVESATQQPQQPHKAGSGYDPMPAVARLQLQVRKRWHAPAAWRCVLLWCVRGLLTGCVGPQLYAPGVALSQRIALRCFTWCACPESHAVLPHPLHPPRESRFLHLHHHPLPSQIEMELAYGWQPLRHGAAVPSLLAHW